MTNAKFDDGATLEGLLSANLDDVADLPSWALPPAGTYIANLSIETKKINLKDAIEFKYVVAETVELADPNDTNPAAGSSFSIAFQIGNPIGLGKFKEAIKPVMNYLGTSSYGDVLSGQVTGMQVEVTLKHRADKKDPDRAYADVTKLSVL